MDPMKKRMLMFLIGCMGARFGLAILAKTLRGVWSTLLSVAFALMGAGFLVIFFGGLRKRGVETGGDLIWWNHIRPIHGVLYLYAAWLLFNGHSCWSSQVIAIDTVIGLVAFLSFHVKEGNLGQILQ